MACGSAVVFGVRHNGEQFSTAMLSLPVGLARVLTFLEETCQPEEYHNHLSGLFVARCYEASGVVLPI